MTAKPAAGNVSADRLDISRLTRQGRVGPGAIYRGAARDGDVCVTVRVPAGLAWAVLGAGWRELSDRESNGDAG